MLAHGAPNLKTSTRFYDLNNHLYHYTNPMTNEQIQAAIPHRAPMLLIDKVVSQTDTTISCRKTFRDDEFFFQGHYPDHPIVPGVILCEVGMQAGAILLSDVIQANADDESGNELSGKVPVATRLNNVKFKKIVKPGDTVEVEVTLTDQVQVAYFLTAKITVEGKLATRFDFACTIADPLA
jgi:3-hydroxyacyl-[acyl-carrier-protein] dehydratase